MSFVVGPLLIRSGEKQGYGTGLSRRESAETSRTRPPEDRRDQGAGSQEDGAL